MLSLSLSHLSFTLFSSRFIFPLTRFPYIIWSGLFRRISVPSARRIREVFESPRGSDVCGSEFLKVVLLRVAEGPAGAPGVVASGKEVGGLLVLLGGSCIEGHLFKVVIASAK